MLIQLVSLVYSPKCDDPMVFLREWRLRRSLVLVERATLGLVALLGKHVRLAVLSLDAATLMVWKGAATTSVVKCINTI